MSSKTYFKKLFLSRSFKKHGQVALTFRLNIPPIFFVFKIFFNKKQKYIYLSKLNDQSPFIGYIYPN